MKILGDDGWGWAGMSSQGNRKSIFHPDHVLLSPHLARCTIKQRLSSNSQDSSSTHHWAQVAMEAEESDVDIASVTEAGPARGFRVLYQKVFPFPARHDLTAWSPQLDLLAVVTDNGNALLYRMNGQRVWGIAHKAANGVTVEQLHWRPDGRVSNPPVGGGEAFMNRLANSFSKERCLL